MILAAILGLTHTATLKLSPVDDVWVYSFAPDQSTDEFLRCWGAGGEELDASGGNVMGSWSNLKFDVSSIPSDKKLTAATLTLWDSGDNFLSPEQTKKFPLYVRKGTVKFEEENFRYTMAETLAPSLKPDSLFGTASPENPGSGKPFSFTVDLLKGEGKFGDYLTSQLKTSSKLIGLTLTSKIDPESSTDGVFYKFYSKSGPKDMRPVLELTFAD